jgi:hypothetical protein
MVYMHVAGSTFVPLYKGTDPTYAAGGCTYSASANVGDAYFNFPLMLPPGSRINSLRFYYNDTAATDGTLRIRRMDDGNPYSEVTTVSSTGSGGIGYSSVTGLNYEVDYSNYSYVLQYFATVTGSTMQLCGARVGYTPPGIFGVALPSVKRN